LLFDETGLRGGFRQDPVSPKAGPYGPAPDCR